MTVAFLYACQKAVDAERAAQEPASAEPPAKRLFVEAFHVTKDWEPSQKDSAALTYLPVTKGEVLHGVPGDAPPGWTQAKRVGGDGGTGHVPTARLRAAPASVPVAAAPPQELSEDDDDEEEDTALDEHWEEACTLDEMQRQVVRLRLTLTLTPTLTLTLTLTLPTDH